MRIGVIGGGSWGTALAAYLARLDHQVALWAFEPEVVEEINTSHTNRVFLPDVALPESLVANGNHAEVLAGADVVLSVVPTQHVRSVIESMRDSIPRDAVLVSASKGIENKTLRRVTEIIREELPDIPPERLLVLGGPCFAKEVIRRQPTAGVLACECNSSALAEIQEVFSSELFRFYTSDDVVGVEICAAIKNVIALASGAISGLALGDNTRAALITRGLAEIARLVKAMGGRSRTVSGLAGVGDMVLTCTSMTSRNFSVGYRLGEGESLDEITKSMKMIAEGVKTTISAVALAERMGVDMPICAAMYAILYQNLPPAEAVRMLMTRGLKNEWETDTGESS